MDSLEQLIRLAKHGDSEKFQLLFTKLQSVISPSQMTTLINSVSKKGQTVLMSAVEGGEIEIVEFLIENKVDVNQQDESKATPLISALCGAFEDITELFLSTASRTKLNVDLSDSDGYTALHWAVKLSLVPVIEKLITTHKAGVNIAAKAGVLPIHSAAGEGLASTLNLLIKHGANVNAQDGSKSTPLHYAQAKQNMEALEILLENGASVDLPNKHHDTVLHIAVANGHTAEVKLFLKYTKNLNILDSEGLSCLHIAKNTGNADIISLLEAAGAQDIGVSQVPSSTPATSEKETTVEDEDDADDEEENQSSSETSSNKKRDPVVLTGDKIRKRILASKNKASTTAATSSSTSSTHHHHHHHHHHSKSSHHGSHYSQFGKEQPSLKFIVIAILGITLGLLLMYFNSSDETTVSPTKLTN